MDGTKKEQLLELLKLAIESPETDKIVITLKPNNCSKAKDDK